MTNKEQFKGSVKTIYRTGQEIMCLTVIIDISESNTTVWKELKKSVMCHML